MFRRLEPTRAAAVTITVDGVPLVARAGDTIAAALLADDRVPAALRAGGAPRAPTCLAGTCQQCWLVVDGRPDVPACITLVREGMRVDIPSGEDAGAPAQSAT